MEIKLISQEVENYIAQITGRISDYQPSTMYGEGLFAHNNTDGKPTKLEARFANPKLPWNNS